MRPPTRVRLLYQQCYPSPDIVFPEYKDDSQLVPRSSSIVVKRMPSQRPGKGKAAMYIAGTNGSAPVPVSEPVQRQGGSTWHKGAMSKRFDLKEDPMSFRASVRRRSEMDPPLAHRRVLHCSQPSTTMSIPKNSVTKEDEAAAMAAMFQAQTANWEETQEKMSQLVSRLCGSSLCSRMKSHNMISVCPLIETVLFEYIIILEEHLSGAVESPLVRISLMLPIVLYHRRTCVTAVARKVSCHAFFMSMLASCFSRALDPRLSNE